MKSELETLKFSSVAARKAVEAEIRAAGLKLKTGKILGLSDLIEQIKTSDADAFVTEADQIKVRFTQPNSGNVLERSIKWRSRQSQKKMQKLQDCAK